MNEKLAILGGPKSIVSDLGDLFTWPIITAEIEAAVLEVLRAGTMSGLDVTRKFEEGFAAWHGMRYALGHNTGTAALQCAMFGLGIGCGDEIICPSITYWASCLPVFSLGGTVVFADVDPETLCIDPNDIENHISERTKAIIVVHYVAMPADMDAIMAIARRHNIKVIEDVSHGHGAMYKNRMVGTIGDVSAYSLMSGKSFPCGEAGMLLTNDPAVYERAIAFGHYARHDKLESEDLRQGAGLPWGGYKYRMHQLSSAVGLEQLKLYPQQMAEIDESMNYFWDLLDGLPAIGSHRPPKDSGTTKGGWYTPTGLYRAEELGGLSVSRFCEAVTAEGCACHPGCNRALHLHPLFNDIDVYGHGRPTRIANLPEGVDIRQKPGSLPVAEGIQQRVFKLRTFRRYRPQIIAEHAAAIRKVVENYRDLLPGDTADTDAGGRWGLTT